MNVLFLILSFSLWVNSERLNENAMNAGCGINNKNSTTLFTEDIDLPKIYSKAIQCYLQAVYHQNKVKADTLFINDRKNGQPDDFPDINLPKIIEGCQIIVLSQKESKSGKHLFKPTSPFVNLVGWADKDKAEFIFFTFHPGFSHRYDCYINFTFNHLTKVYDLDPIRIEVLIYDKSGKADHFAVYEDGKYIRDKQL